MDHCIQTNDGKQIERLKKVIVEYNISEIEWVTFLFNNEVIAPKKYNFKAIVPLETRKEFSLPYRVGKFCFNEIV